MVIMFEKIWTRLVNKNVEVTIDPRLTNSIQEHNRNINMRNQPVIVPIQIYKLIKSIAIVNPIRYFTKRNKFLDEAALIERIILDEDSDFKVRIEDRDDDIQIIISRKLGEGISVNVADFIFGLKWSTLAKIKRRGVSLPDIKAFSNLSRYLVWEAKGSINTYSNEEKNHAVRQKNRRPADVNFASLAILRENLITQVEILDPPSMNPENLGEKELLLKAGHYSRIFNFIGQKELGLYFDHMRKRILYDRNFPEFREKTELFNKIKKDYIKIVKSDKIFLGNIEKINENEYFFIGIDKDLISLPGFKHFSDYPEDINIHEKENSYTITSDGICIAILKDISFLSDQLDGKTIPHYQETISIRDIDTMNFVAFNNFINYLLNRIGAKIETQIKSDKKYEKNYVFDYLVTYEGKKFLIEFSKSIDKYVINQLTEYMKFLEENRPSDDYNAILITSQKLDDKILDYSKNSRIKIIGREDLKRILRKYDRLKYYLNSSR